MAAWFNANSTPATNIHQLYKLGDDGSVTMWTANPGDNTEPDQGLNPFDLTLFNNAVWFSGETSSDGNQLYKLGADGSVTLWTDIHVGKTGLFGNNSNPDMTVFNNALWFNGNDAPGGDGEQLYKLGADNSVTKWTSLNSGGGGLDPQNLIVFNNALWFDGLTPANGFQLFKLGNDGSVTKWTSIGTNLNPVNDVIFNNALWFTGFNAGQFQLYKLGADGSVTQWTDIFGGGVGLVPADKTVFNDALWFFGETPANGFQLFKLGNDGSVTQWTSIGPNLGPGVEVIFNNALWFPGFNAGQQQLYKLGADGSVTQWTANPGFGNGLEPQFLTVFNDALWFAGQTPTHGQQLFKLGNDGSVTQWTDIFGGGIGLNPVPVSAAAFDPDSTPLSVANNALWFQGHNPTMGIELYKLGADGSFTLWKDINPGPDSSMPKGWAVLG
jgi:ELWxxDGT repeat protein